MRKHFICLLLFACLVTIAEAQIKIGGKIVSAIDSQPIANVSVYINNTSIGTTTNDAGEFSLAADINGNVDLVASHIAFQRKTTHINPSESTNMLTIALDPRSTALKEVSISDGALTGWRKWKGLFTQYFIGNMEFAKKCRIQNPEVLVFHYDKVNQVLKVSARGPLVVANRALGYLYKIDLDDFTYSFAGLRVNSDVTTFFLEIKPVDPAEEKAFIANRKYAFGGSKMHFIQSLYRKNYQGEGFSIIAVHLKKNVEKLWLQHQISEALAKAYQANKSANTVTLASIASGNKDTVSYYEQVLGQPDFVIGDTTSVSLKDSLTFNTQFKNATLRLPDTLLIQYNEQHRLKPTIFQLPVRNASFTISDKQLSFARKKENLPLQYSILLLTPGQKINLYTAGNYDGNDIFTDGYMANGKIAYMLPWDYRNSE